MDLKWRQWSDLWASLSLSFLLPGRRKAASPRWTQHSHQERKLREELFLWLWLEEKSFPTFLGRSFFFISLVNYHTNHCPERFEGQWLCRRLWFPLPPPPHETGISSPEEDKILLKQEEDFVMVGGVSPSLPMKESPWVPSVFVLLVSVNPLLTTALRTEPTYSLSYAELWVVFCWDKPAGSRVPLMLKAYVI